MVCPGGAYMVCPRHGNEGDPVAMAFAIDGYQSFVLEYSVAERAPKGKTLFPAQVIDLGKAIKTIREHADEWCVDVDKISIIGFSAGAHLCGMYATTWSEPLLAETFGVDSSVFKPLSAMLIYGLLDYTIQEKFNKANPHPMLPPNLNEPTFGCIVPLKEGDVFNLGGITLKVVEVPGHTTGSIGLIYEEENWLYAGDAMGSFLWLFAEEATTLSVFFETLKKAIGLGCDKFLIGHYPDLLDSQYLENFLDCATHVDYSKGIPFKNPIIQGYEARICANGEIRMDKISDPNFPMLVISENKIDC
ncbi:MBL fold metallo-hydrolase [Neobacillus cucumis]|nr:MBL fold metallo-hydrolase [Neobacillus cucumis]MDR4946118.1 MBL fold metallo-hydrolase [Neobacillus cucumis]